MIFFGGKKVEKEFSKVKDFEYLSENDIYLDSACQTLRPEPVIKSLNEYFRKYNTCGGRVKYRWGKKVDEEVENTRKKILSYLGKSEKEYSVAFTLNTTYGLNLILQQLPLNKYEQIISSEIEHNSVFLSTMTASKKLNIPRKILVRKKDGSLDYNVENIENAIVVLNACSNIDGRVLKNAKILSEDIHKNNGIFVVDAAQAMLPARNILKETDFDALCFSSHKMNGPSLGAIVIKKQLLKSLDCFFVGGGMTHSVSESSFILADEPDFCRLEPGLQDFGGIIALGKTIDWLEEKDKKQYYQEDLKKIYSYLFTKLSEIPKIHLINKEPTSTISFYFENIDSHRLAHFLSEQNIMTRSGYFCCHYYLENVKKYPPLLRVSLGMHNSQKDVEKFIEVIKKIVYNIS